MTRIRAIVVAFLAPLALLAAPPGLAADFPKPIEDAIASAKNAMMSDPANSLPFTNTADALARELPEGRQRLLAMATVRWLAAEAHLRIGKPDKAGPLLDEALRLIQPIREPLKLRADLLLSQGVLYIDQEKAATALSRFQDAYRIFGEVKEARSQAITLQNIALLYYAANDYGRAEHYYRQAAEAYDDDPMLSYTLHVNRGNVLLTLERYADAEAEYRRAIDLARRQRDSLLEVRVIVNLVRAQVFQNKLGEADVAVRRGFSLLQGEDAAVQRRHLLASAAKLSAVRGDYSRAASLIGEAFRDVDVETTTGVYRAAHLYAHEIYRELGNTPLALAHLEALKRLDDESAKVATTTGAALMAARFDYANQELRIANLKAEELRRTAAFQRTLFIGIGLATLVIIALLLVALFLIRRSRDQVRAANVVLGETNVALEKALKAKTEFLATTSHEIRTPLNGILGMTQVMLSDTKLAPDMRDRIGIVHGAGMTMRSLVDDILDVAKMETGNLTVDAAPMDLCATLKEVTRMWEEQARAKGIAFSLQLTHAPHWIVSDAGRLRQIVFNLLSNAIKFTSKGGVAVRAVAEGEGDARRLKLSVADTGIGIPAEKREEIFESFKQVDAGTTRKFGGTGLGLTICRNLARALGGDIAVESSDGLGSTFTIDLPLVVAEAPEAETGTAAGGALLILDRNPIARSMLKTLLEPRVASLRFVSTPEEAMVALGEGTTQFLIDEATLKAGGDDAFALLARFVEASDAVGARATLLWQKADAETRDRLGATGIGQIVEKPVSGAALVAALVPETKLNHDRPDSGPLVSRAA